MYGVHPSFMWVMSHFFPDITIKKRFFPPQLFIIYEIMEILWREKNSMKFKSFIIFAHIEDGLFWIPLQEEVYYKLLLRSWVWFNDYALFHSYVKIIWFLRVLIKWYEQMRTPGNLKLNDRRYKLSDDIASLYINLVCFSFVFEIECVYFLWCYK